MNHRIALYLAGKYPGIFVTPDKLLFIDSLQEISAKEFSDDKFKMFGMFGQVDEYEFFLSFLNKVERNFPNKYLDLLGKLNIPSDIVEKYQNCFNHDVLKGKLSEIEKITNSQAKGKGFEIFLKEMFDKIAGLDVLDIKESSDEQIDLIVKNNINRPFWIGLRSSIMLIEAKNWTKNTPTEVLNTLRGKLSGHKNFSRIGIVIALNGFTEEVDKNIIRDGSGENIIIPITGDDIRIMLNMKEDPVLRLENKLTDTFK